MKNFNNNELRRLKYKYQILEAENDSLKKELKLRKGLNIFWVACFVINIILDFVL